MWSAHKDFSDLFRKLFIVYTPIQNRPKKFSYHAIHE